MCHAAHDEDMIDIADRVAAAGEYILYHARKPHRQLAHLMLVDLARQGEIQLLPVEELRQIDRRDARILRIELGFQPERLCPDQSGCPCLLRTCEDGAGRRVEIVTGLLREFPGHHPDEQIIHIVAAQMEVALPRDRLQTVGV